MFKYHGLPTCHIYLTVPYLILELHIYSRVIFFVSYLICWQKKSSTPYIPQNSTPCATLFVANLGPSCNEQELMQVFSRLVDVYAWGVFVKSVEFDFVSM